jgi:hypothetical protein
MDNPLSAPRTTDAVLWIDRGAPTLLFDYMLFRGADLSGWTRFDRIYGIARDASAVIGEGTRGTASGIPFVAFIDEPAPVPCADVSGDGIVTFIEITSVLAYWGTSSPFGDADGNGSVNFDDLTTVLSHFGEVCE